MKIFYWSPFTSNVATIKAVINSAKGLKHIYNHDISLINAIGEWNKFKDILKKNNLRIIDKNYLLKMNSDGYFRSRLIYTIIFLKSFMFLKKILIKEKPDFLIIHLITSLPIILFIIFNFKTKLILRVSGLPKLGFFRRLLWKIASKKINIITVPSIHTLKNLRKLKIFNSNKVYYLPDPILDKNFSKITKIKIKYSNFLVNIGRLTNQKNQKMLIESFKVISEKYKNLKLLILGNGELKKDLLKQRNELNLKKKVIFLGHIKNPAHYIKKSLCVIVSSLWEDPGFVMIESSRLKKMVICSDCPNGPKEFFRNGKNGYLFKNNNIKSLIKSFDSFMNTKNSILKKKINLNFKNSKIYTTGNHSKIFNKILIKHVKKI